MHEVADIRVRHGSLLAVVRFADQLTNLDCDPSDESLGDVDRPLRGLFGSSQASFFPKPCAYPKRMPIRMPQMKLAHVPRLIRRRHRHCQSILDREFVRSVDRRR
jgi:hypothetical protein